MFYNFFNGPKKRSVLVLGCDGMLGYELYERLRKLSLRKNSNIGTVIGLDVKDGIDVTQRHALGNFFMESIHFDYCVNCIAYTDTNAAQNTKEGRELDYRLNALAPGYVAESCKYWKTKLIHVSTDYVFSEKSKAYAHNAEDGYTLLCPCSEPFPCNTYGYDKLLGEMFISNVFGKDIKDYCIMRTSWIYGMHNSKSFVHKFVRNLVKSAAEGKKEVEMTSNEHSVPTPCSYVVDCIMDAIDGGICGTCHAVPACDSKGVSRLEFAQKILDRVSELRASLSGMKLIGIERDSYWPKFSAMKSSATWSAGWNELLKRFLDSNAEDILEWAERTSGVK